MAFSPIEIEFLRRLSVESVPSRPAGKAATLFAEHHGIGTLLGRRVHYTKQDIANATAMLAALGGSTTRLPAGALRSDAAGRGGVLSEKIGTAAPHSNSIMVKTAHGHCSANFRSLKADRGGYHVVTRESACAVHCDVVMFVENLETFRYLEDYRWIDFLGRNVLAVYRGDNTFRGDDALVMAEGDRPVWLFGDFDPAGLGIAVALARRCNLERVVHPNINWLEEKVAESGLPRLYGEQYQQYSAVLDGSGRPDIARLWSVLRKAQSGLPQEWMITAAA